MQKKTLRSGDGAKEKKITYNVIRKGGWAFFLQGGVTIEKNIYP